MVYSVVRGLLRIFLRFYFKKIYFLTSHYVPQSGPTILACNHPNAFMDAMISTSFLKRKVHFLVRSDVFTSRFKIWLLGLLNLAPVYRIQEGHENLRKNEDTFKRCYKILENGGMILVFSEGTCRQEKRIRPLRKRNSQDRIWRRREK